MHLRASSCALVAMVLCACGRPAARLEQARDLALSGHHQTALLEARALLLTLRDDSSPSVDLVRRGALKLSGDLCALHLDDPRCAASEYRELVKKYPTAPEAFEARERLGDLDMRIGDVRGALEAWRDQVATAPDRPGADVAQLKIARAHAARYGANPRAIVLSGTLSSDGQGYDWRWTFQCDGSVYAVVSAGPQSVRVVSHGIRTWLMGVAAFDPSKVNVDAGDLLQLLKKQGYAQPDSMSLTEPLTQKPAPRWTVSESKKTVLVDATSGDVSG